MRTVSRRAFAMCLWCAVQALGLGTVLAQKPNDGQGYKPLLETDSLLVRLREWSTRIPNVKCDFCQEKRAALLLNASVASGRFYYRNDASVRFTYEQPERLVLIVRPDSLLMEMDGKRTEIPLRGKGLKRGNPLMAEMQKLVRASLGGDLQAVKGQYGVEYASNGKLLRIVFIPKNQMVKQMLNRVSIYMEQERFRVEELVIQESNGDTLSYRFSNHVECLELPEELFTLGHGRK